MQSPVSDALKEFERALSIASECIKIGLEKDEKQERETAARSYFLSFEATDKAWQKLRMLPNGGGEHRQGLMDQAERRRGMITLRALDILEKHPALWSEAPNSLRPHAPQQKNAPVSSPQVRSPGAIQPPKPQTSPAPHTPPRQWASSDPTQPKGQTYGRPSARRSLPSSPASPSSAGSASPQTAKKKSLFAILTRKKSQGTPQEPPDEDLPPLDPPTPPSPAPAPAPQPTQEPPKVSQARPRRRTPSPPLSDPKSPSPPVESPSVCSSGSTSSSAELSDESSHAGSAPSTPTTTRARAASEDLGRGAPEKKGSGRGFFGFIRRNSKSQLKEEEPPKTPPQQEGKKPRGPLISPRGSFSKFSKKEQPAQGDSKGKGDGGKGKIEEKYECKLAPKGVPPPSMAFPAGERGRGRERESGPFAAIRSRSAGAVLRSRSQKRQRTCPDKTNDPVHKAILQLEQTDVDDGILCAADGV